jgi:hypothetical protein
MEQVERPVQVQEEVLGDVVEKAKIHNGPMLINHNA